MLIRSSLVLLAITAPLPGCTLDEDAGDIAFVQQAIPTVLGRKARGSAEIEALHDLMVDQLVTRTDVIDMLVQDPEYADYWSLVLADALEVRRGDGDLATDPTCWGEPLVSDHAALAAHLATASPNTPYNGGPWNMTDALRAAVVSDDLSIAWIAYLPVLAGSISDIDEEYPARVAFDDVYLNRAPDCITCHSSSYSTVDERSGWDRHQTSPWALEASVFRGDGAPPTPAPLLAAYTAGAAQYTAHCDTCHDAQGTAVKQLFREGAVLPTPITLANRVPVLTHAQIEGKIRAGGVFPNSMTAFPEPAPGADTATTLSATELTALLFFLRTEFGGEGDVQSYFRSETVDGGAGVRPWGIHDSCGPEIEAVTMSGRDGGFAGRKTDQPDAIDLALALRAGLTSLRTELDSPPATVSAHLLPQMDGEDAFAYLVASAIADDVLHVTSGSRPTVAHGFARTPAQEELRAAVVNAMVTPPAGGAPSKLSLRAALEGVVDANYHAPADSEIPMAYWWPMILEPWVATEPGSAPQPGDDANSVGDLVHRYDPVTLLWATHHTLGWPEPVVMRDDADYPNEALAVGLGAFRSSEMQGFDTWDSQSLGLWEATAGSCTLAPAGSDWISALRAAAIADSEPQAVTVLDTFAALRDRVLGSPAMSAEELAAIEIAVGATPGELAVTPFPKTDVGRQDAVEQALREYCGALVLSPHYLLAGIPVVTELPASRRLEVCLPGETCTYADLHAWYDAL